MLTISALVSKRLVQGQAGQGDRRWAVPNLSTESEAKANHSVDPSRMEPARGLAGANPPNDAPIVEVKVPVVPVGAGQCQWQRTATFSITPVRSRSVRTERPVPRHLRCGVVQLSNRTQGLLADARQVGRIHKDQDLVLDRWGKAK